MSTLVRIGTLGAVLLALSGCSTVSYVVDWDAANDFSGYRTFAWYELAPPRGQSASPAVPNAIVADRIQRAVAGALSQRGLQPAAAGEADLLVTYSIALQQGVRVYHSGWSHTCWGRCGWGSGWGSSSAWTVLQGTLIVDVLDGSRRRLVWRGVAEGAFKRPNPSDEQVAKVVGRMMESFPPR